MTLALKIAKVANLGITCIKNSDNPYYNSKYADLSTVVQALKQPLNDAGLGYRFETNYTCDEDGTPKSWTVDLRVVDLDDGYESTVCSFPIPATEPQKIGSAITYAKRYMLTTAFNVIAEEDDDGNATVDKKDIPKRQPQALATKPKFFN